jgi:glucose-6-phosphate isomerase
VCPASPGGADVAGPGLLCYKKAMIRTAGLNAWNKPIHRALASSARERVLERILAGDYTVWKDEDRGITKRLGWLDPVPKALKALPAIDAFVNGVRRDGISRVLLLGMGGSSLAPEVFSRVFRARPGYPRLEILDTTAPDAVARTARGIDIGKTLFIVSSKSGTTAETSSLFNYFYGRACDALGEEGAGPHFAVITDPGSPLEGLAGRHGFRRVFLGDPEVGGRFSALSVFGLVPAAVAGIDVRKALVRSEATIRACRSTDPGDNPAALLGTVLGVLAGRGVDKATIFASARVRSLGAWLEQLVAESTGKDGKGILPVPEDAPASPLAYGPDRLFVHARFGADASLDKGLAALSKRGFPVITIGFPDTLSLPGQFYLWEMATAVAGHILGIDPFDQPDVEATKKKTREALQAAGAGATEGPSRSGPKAADPEAGTLERFLSRPRKGAYIALQAFVDPSPATVKAFREFRDSIRDATRLPVTLGFGPRFLHSTGQLHKGDAGRGLFLQFVVRAKADVPIPEVDGARPAPSFGTLIAAQARGDLLALEEAGRNVIRLEPGADVRAGLRRLAGAL